MTTLLGSSATPLSIEERRQQPKMKKGARSRSRMFSTSPIVTRSRFRVAAPPRPGRLSRSPRASAAGDPRRGDVVAGGRRDPASEQHGLGDDDDPVLDARSPREALPRAPGELQPMASFMARVHKDAPTNLRRAEATTLAKGRATRKATKAKAATTTSANSAPAVATAAPATRRRRARAARLHPCSPLRPWRRRTDRTEGGSARGARVGGSRPGVRPSTRQSIEPSSRRRVTHAKVPLMSNATLCAGAPMATRSSGSTSPQRPSVRSGSRSSRLRSRFAWCACLSSRRAAWACGGSRYLVGRARAALGPGGIEGISPGGAVWRFVVPFYGSTGPSVPTSLSVAR